MQRIHGDADRLIAPGVDLGEFDRSMASASEDEQSAEAVRTILANDFTGPGRFGKMFPNLNPFRPSDEALAELGHAMREAQPRVQHSTIQRSLRA